MADPFEPVVLISFKATTKSRDTSGASEKETSLGSNREASYPPKVKLPNELPIPRNDVNSSETPISTEGLRLTIIGACSIAPRKARDQILCFQSREKAGVRIGQCAKITRLVAEAENASIKVIIANGADHLRFQCWAPSHVERI